MRGMGWMGEVYFGFEADGWWGGERWQCCHGDKTGDSLLRDSYL